MRQLVYISTATAAPATAIDPADILAVSRRNNARDAITGALWFDGKRFLQALEGEEAAVDAAFRRIERDPRHKAIVLLSSRSIERREFGDWAMAFRDPRSTGEAAVMRIGDLTANAAPEVRATFDSFARIRRAA